MTDPLSELKDVPKDPLKEGDFYDYHPTDPTKIIIRNMSELNQKTGLYREDES